MASDGQSFKVSSSAQTEVLQVMELLITLARVSKKVKHYWGPTEEELRKASSLSEQEFNQALYTLLNQHKCIVHRYSQEGTAGPFAHRYEAAKNLSLEATW